MARNFGFKQDSDTEALKVQLRELSVRLARTETTVNELDRSTDETVIDILPTLVNFLNNSDFLYDYYTYDNSSFDNDDDVLYGWYVQPQGGTTVWDTPLDSLPASQAITKLTFPTGVDSDYPSIGAYWQTSEGAVALAGGYRLGGRLDVVRGYAGNYIITRMQVALRRRTAQTVAHTDVTNDSGLKFSAPNHNLITGTKGQMTTTGTLPTGVAVDTDYYIIRVDGDSFKLATSFANAGAGTPVLYTDTGSGNHTFTPSLVLPPEDLKLKVSLYDNLAGEIMTGGYPDLTLTKVGTHTGVVSRDYVVEVHMPDGSRFYSKKDAFSTGDGNRVENTDDPATVSNSNFVTVSWDRVSGASRYRVYRRTAPAGTWYLVGTTTSSSLRDKGGIGGGEWTEPAYSPLYKQYQKAETFFDDIGAILQTEDQIQEVTLAFHVPHNFVGTYGTQYLQVEFLNSDYSNTTVEDLPMVTIDKVGMSYTNGRWAPSARDLAMQTGGIPVTPPPTPGGGGDNPPGGGILTRCVHEDTEVLVWVTASNWQWMPAKHVAVGDSLVAWDTEQKCLAPSKVRKIVHGISTANMIFHMADGGELRCTMSHRPIAHAGDFQFGTTAKRLTDSIYGWNGEEMLDIPVVGVEQYNSTWKVITFQQERNRKNYITRGVAGGYFNHNKDEPEPGDEPQIEL